LPSLRSVHRFTLSRNLLDAAFHIIAAEAMLSCEESRVQTTGSSRYSVVRHTIQRSTRGGQV
jgi:hypothetical protein